MHRAARSGVLSSHLRRAFVASGQAARPDSLVPPRGICPRGSERPRRGSASVRGTLEEARSPHSAPRAGASLPPGLVAVVGALVEMTLAVPAAPVVADTASAAGTVELLLEGLAAPGASTRTASSCLRPPWSSARARWPARVRRCSDRSAPSSPEGVGEVGQSAARHRPCGSGW